MVGDQYLLNQIFGFVRYSNGEFKYTGNDFLIKLHSVRVAKWKVAGNHGE